jgi:hypothetical protein
LETGKIPPDEILMLHNSCLKLGLICTFFFFMSYTIDVGILEILFR